MVVETLLVRLTFDQALARVRQRGGGPRAEEVGPLLEEIRRDGDAAVLRLAERFDGFARARFEVPADELRDAAEALPADLRQALDAAIRRVREFATRQRAMMSDLECVIDGVRLGHRVVPMTRAAIYAPGGRYPLPSSVIMGVVPARVAGVDEVVVLSPKLHPVTAAAAWLAGADRVFDLGGVQGVAAAAWGLAGVPRVDIVVGPGNRYVTEAKRRLYGEVGIEFPAGPSELLIIADGTASPRLLAADLLAQAEHDPDAWPVLVALDDALPAAVERELAAQLATLPPGSPAHASIRGGFVTVCDADQAVALCDALAPEHLELCGPVAEVLSDRVRNCGAEFIGPLSAEVFGDYGSGTNHILPTGGAARFAGGVWVGTFLKVVTWQRVAPAALPTLVAQTGLLADAEGLVAHARSARLRAE